MDLFLVRHGETDANAKHIIQGWMNTDLNETGRHQAEETARGFSEKIEAIYASDLNRVKQTASAFRQKFPDLPYFEDERLRERNFGEAAGNPRDNYDWDEFWSAPGNLAPLPGAETLDDYNTRVREFIADLKKSGFQKVLIVSHSGTINRLRHLIADEAHTKHANGSVTHLVLQ